MADTPQRFGRYEVQRVLGTGAFGTVFLAEDPALDDRVAVKVLAENWSFDPDVRARFLTEARVIRRIRSDRLVRVHDLGETADHRPYYVMDLATGGTLEDRLAARSTPETAAVADAATVVRSLAAGLRDLHRAGVVHRDLKPSNILFRDRATSSDERLVGDDEALLLSDFGLAKLLEDGSHLTIAGGSPGYMAPEQREAGGAIDARTDLYAATAIVMRVLTGSLANPSTAVPVSAAVRDALGCGLSPDPADRPVDVDAWESLLLGALTAPGLDSHPQALATAARRASVRRPPRWLLAGVVAVVTVIATALWFLDGGDTAFAIDGPATIEIGAPASFRAAHDDELVTHWIDTNGRRVDGDELSIEPISVGQLTVTLVGTDRRGAERRIQKVVVVEQPTLRAEIGGPARITVGRAVDYTAVLRGAIAHYWTDWDGKRVEGDPFVVEASSQGSLRFSLTATDSFGRTVTVEKSIVVVSA